MELRSVAGAASGLLGRLGRLGPAETKDVDVERDLPMPAAEGVVLLADRWYPRQRPAGLPVILLRSPYGRRPFGLLARLIAERGYQVVVQSCRGTFGSGGEWLPFRNEAADGQAAYQWLAEQPWWGGLAAGFGPSYLGLTQWAVAAGAPPGLAAIAPLVTARRFRDVVVFPGGSFALETGAAWLYLLAHQERGLAGVVWAQLRARRLMRPAFTTVPLAAADRAMLGRTVGFYQDWLAHEQPGDAWWDAVDFTTGAEGAPPASFVGGWHDIFLPAQIGDYVALRDAGRSVRLTVGPWTHSSPRALLAGLADGLEWFDQHLRGRPPRRTAPVRLWVLGRGQWVDLERWPPPAAPERWYLHAEGRLSPRPPTAAGTPGGGADRFRYDPADPTPSVGGPSLNAANAGPKDQARRERRADVLTYTSDPLDRTMTVAGPLSAELWVRPSTEFVDVHVRLCTVDRHGRSRNVSDGILRLCPEPARDPDPDLAPGAPGRVAAAPEIGHGGGPGWGEVERGPDGVLRVRLRMWPTALSVAPGERLRLQVSAGAHPLFARNLCGGEPLGEATRLVAVEQTVWRDPAHPSGIDLPVSSI